MVRATTAKIKSWDFMSCGVRKISAKLMGRTAPAIGNMWNTGPMGVTSLPRKSHPPAPNVTSRQAVKGTLFTEAGFPLTEKNRAVRQKGRAGSPLFSVELSSVQGAGRKRVAQRFIAGLRLLPTKSRRDERTLWRKREETKKD